MTESLNYQKTNVISTEMEKSRKLSNEISRLRLTSLEMTNGPRFGYSASLSLDTQTCDVYVFPVHQGRKR